MGRRRARAVSARRWNVCKPTRWDKPLRFAHSAKRNCKSGFSGIVLRSAPPRGAGVSCGPVERAERAISPRPWSPFIPRVGA